MEPGQLLADIDVSRRREAGGIVEGGTKRWISFGQRSPSKLSGEPKRGRSA